MKKFKYYIILKYDVILFKRIKSTDTLTMKKNVFLDSQFICM